MTITLTAEKREMRGRETQRLRKMGKIPAIVYGSIKEPLVLAIDACDFGKVFHEAGESTMIEISIDNAMVPVLIHDIARNATNNAIEHIDFYAIDKTHEVHVHVPIVFVGEAPVEKTGVITKVIHHLNVSALPSELPHDITVDISTLVDIESTIRVRDIVVPKGVKLLHDLEEVIVAVSEQTVEEAPAHAEEQSEPELVNKKEESVK